MLTAKDFYDICCPYTDGYFKAYIIWFFTDFDCFRSIYKKM